MFPIFWDDTCESFEERDRRSSLISPDDSCRGALTIRADAGEVAGYLEEALKLRRSESTERNPLSSRSHVAGLNISQVGS